MFTKQQLDSLVLGMNKAITESLSNTHTSTIAKVTKINGGVISVKPVFKRVVNDVDIELPEFVDVPVLTLQGGNNYRIMPISVGDYALLIFTERCIDDWFVGGSDNKRPRELRMHDYSDAIAIVGLNKLSNAISIPTDHEKVQGDVIQTGDYILNGNETINDGILTIPATSDIQIVTSGGTVSLRNFVENHYHTQDDDSNGDTEPDTSTAVIP